MRDFFNKYILPPVMIAVIGVLAYGGIKQAKRTHNLYAQMNELEGSITDLEERNEDLRAAIDNFQDPSTIDKEARRRLNLKKEGEEVVVIIPSEERRDHEIEEVPAEKKEPDSFWDKVMSWFREGRED